MRWAIAVLTPFTLMLGGCQFVSSVLFPLQALHVTNLSTLTVVVRVGAFVPGKPLVSESDAVSNATLAPGGNATLQLAHGHYEVYAQANTASAEDAVTDVTLDGSAPPALTLEQRIEDRTGDKTGPGYRTYQLGWAVN